MLTILVIAGALPLALSQYSEDYPKDGKYRSAQHAFDHPYPVVQESADYDRDYVKDENNDKGEWKAQMEYDRLRAMIAKAKKELPDLQGEKDQTQKEYDEAVADQKRVDEEVKEDEPVEEIEEEDDEHEEEEKEEQVEHEEKEIKFPDEELPSEPKETISTQEVEEAMVHLKDCQQQLEDAKDKLLKLLDERDDIRHKKQKADTAQTEAQAAYDAAKKATKDAEAQVKVAEDNFAESESAYKKEVQDVEELEATLEEAAVTIRHVRSQVDNRGGIYQSAAQKSASSVVWATLSVLVASMWAQ